MALLVLVPVYYFAIYINAIKLEPGRSNTIWVHSQNGNDNSALVNVSSSGDNQVKLKYSVEKYAEIGVIDLPDVHTIFPPILEGTTVRAMRIAAFEDGLTIVDLNKTCYMNGVITSWNVVSQEDGNEVKLAIFRHDEAKKEYQLIRHSPTRIARKGLNTFLEQTPLDIKQNDILGIIIKNPISSNRVIMNEVAKVFTMSGSKSSVSEAVASQDSINGSYSFSALLEAGKEQGEILDLSPHSDIVIRIPQNPVYGHLAWYKFTFSSESGVIYLKPSIAATILNADPFVALTQESSSPWTPKAFSFLLLATLVILLALIAKLLSSSEQDIYPPSVTIVSILTLFGLAKYYLPALPELQFVTIVVAFLMVFLLPGIIISRYYPMYGEEFATGRIVLAFVLSIVFWFLPAVSFSLVKSSYWPFILATTLLVGLVFLKQPAREKIAVFQDGLSPYWNAFRFALWGIVVLLAVHTLFSSRFHAESFDTFHHLSLAAKNFALPISGDTHTNLYGISMQSMAPYAHNYWGLLVGMVVKISGLDIGTIYCVGSSLLVLFMFIAQWWLIGLLVDSEKLRVTAFAIILMIYITRSLATFAPLFQRSELVFVMYGPSIHEFALYAVYIVLGIRTIKSKRTADCIVYLGLSLASGFFHMEFLFFNCIVLSLLMAISLIENGKLYLDRTQVYLLTTICLLIFAGWIVTSHLALGKIVDANNDHYPWFYALRYEESNIFFRFYYLLKDLLEFTYANIWNLVAIWGGLLLLIFKHQSTNLPARLFRAVYFVILLILFISFNPIAELILTPLITSWPLQRIGIYLRAITFTIAAVTLSIGFAYIIRFAINKFKHIRIVMYALPAIVAFLMLLSADQWLPQIKSTVFTTIYNQGNYFDITSIANLPEFKFLNEYSKEKHVVVLAEKTYSYAIPSLSYTYSYYHNHYPDYITQFEERRPIWKDCLSAEKNCGSLLPDDSVLLVRNADVVKFNQLGYLELFRGRLFTVLKA